MFGRTTLFKELVLLHQQNCTDKNYKDSGRDKTAQTRMLICKGTLWQPIGHLGDEITTFGMHGHYMTMKFSWPGVYKDIWDKVACYCHKYNVGLFAGDFNMALTHVCHELSSRGLLCDCIAWYPWAFGPKVKTNGYSGNQRLGFDSM